MTDPLSLLLGCMVGVFVTGVIGAICMAAWYDRVYRLGRRHGEESVNMAAIVQGYKEWISEEVARDKGKEVVVR